MEAPKQVSTEPPQKPAQPPRWEFRHPVLTMMGIPRIRVPSRNWLIFWTVTGSLVAGYYWDRSERKKVRDYWISRVEYLGEQPVNPLDVSRKVTVYAAPPPNDYIDATLQHFRNFIKPVLTAAAVDHELVLEERQGYIRSRVAEEVRSLRRKLQSQAGGTEEDKPKSVFHRDNTGGIMLIGRGAYKEYVSGLQEGWFGPLDRPDFVDKQIEEEKAAEKERLRKRHAENAKSTEGDDPMQYDDEETYKEDHKAALIRKFPVIPAYVRATDLAELDAPPELALQHQQPISVFRLPHLLGIFMMPKRIYRWLNQRHLAEEMGSQAVGVVYAVTRPFEPEDVELAYSDENDWPTKFKQKGLDNDSEWMREFVVDPRFGAHLSVYRNAERSPPSAVGAEDSSSPSQ